MWYCLFNLFSAHTPSCHETMNEKKLTSAAGLQLEAERLGT
jgi:hypothetical protein